MSDARDWQFDLEPYLREGEPDKAARADAWQTAIGLQAVDGLKTSRYLYETAVRHIEGDISIDEAQRRIQSYYEERALRGEVEKDTKEGDVVSSRIARLLNEQAFNFSPVELRSIHRRLFADLMPLSGEYRPYNMIKKEWVLGGETVLYASYETISATLEYDFERERSFGYVDLSQKDIVEHIASFVADIWQVHPFCEGNTRTTAIFAIRYLRSLGYAVDNTPFKEHSWYFRNALVRANYDNFEAGVTSTIEYLVLFLENVLLGAHHELRNRYLHVDWRDESSTPQVTHQVKPSTLQVTPQVEAVLKALGDEELSLREIMGRVGLTDRVSFAKRHLKPALEAGVIERTIPDKPTSRLQRYRRVKPPYDSGDIHE